ncbi:MAG TPA: RecX family transcriptional regulator [Vicinamibacterales bacterium]
MADRAYLDGLRLLARRELSTTQLRERLTRRARHAPEDIDAAIERLTAERALDDARTAAAIARTATAVRRLGPRRVRRAIQSAGISEDLAETAVRSVFAEVDREALIETTLDRRLTSHEGPIDDRTAARLYRHLLSQGHDPDLVARLLRARRQQHGRG